MSSAVKSKTSVPAKSQAKACSNLRTMQKKGTPFFSHLIGKSTCQTVSKAKAPMKKSLKSCTEGSTLFKQIQKGAVGISTYLRTADYPLAQGSGFSVENTKWATHVGGNTPIIVTAAHLALPSFTRDVNPVCMPFLVQPNSATGTNEPNYGVTVLGQWPYRYIADMFHNDTEDSTKSKRIFVELELLGVDWKHDVAVFWIPDLGGQQDQYDYATLSFSDVDPEVGDDVYSVSNLWNQVPTIFANGIIRQNNYQMQAEFSPIMTTTLELGSASSGAPIVRSNGKVVGIHLAHVVDATTFSIGATWHGLTYTIDKILDAVIFTDTHTPVDNGSSGNDRSKLSVVLAVSMPDLACSASLYNVGNVMLNQYRPINAGYVYGDSEPYGGCQNILDAKDLIIAIDDVELGPYDYQSNISDAIEGKDQVNLTYLPFANGYGPADRVDSNAVTLPIKIQNDVGNFWMWWFRWGLPPGGVPSSNGLSADAPGAAPAVPVSF